MLFFEFSVEMVVFSRLQVIADRLVEHFVSAGLMVREWDRVKLHGTVMNTRFRMDRAGRAQRINGKLNSSVFKNKVIDML